MSEKDRWIRNITDIVIDLLELSNGDAQGYVESRHFALSQEWAKGSTAEEAAEQLIGTNTP